MQHAGCGHVYHRVGALSPPQLCWCAVCRTRTIVRLLPGGHPSSALRPRVLCRSERHDGKRAPGERAAAASRRLCLGALTAPAVGRAPTERLDAVHAATISMDTRRVPLWPKASRPPREWSCLRAATADASGWDHGSCRILHLNGCRSALSSQPPSGPAVSTRDAGPLMSSQSHVLCTMRCPPGITPGCGSQCDRRAGVVGDRRASSRQRPLAARLHSATSSSPGTGRLARILCDLLGSARRSSIFCG